MSKKEQRNGMSEACQVPEISDKSSPALTRASAHNGTEKVRSLCKNGR